MYIMGCCPVKKSPPARQVLGAFLPAAAILEQGTKGNGEVAYAADFGMLFSWRWPLGLPACTPGVWVGRRCGEAGPCTVTVTCPGGPAPAVYSYDLVGAGFCRTIHIFYDPAYPGDNYGIFQNLPPGEYRLLENGWEEARCRFLWRLLPLRFGRITPGPLLWPGRFCARCAKRCMHFCNIIRLRRLSFHGIMTLYREVCLLHAQAIGQSP